MEKYILAIDAGTTSNRAIIFNRRSEIVAVSQKEFTQYFPKPGWVEQDAEEIWETVQEVIHNVLYKAGIKAQDVAAIGITNQRETTVCWDKKTGQSITRAICWQCRRTAALADRLKDEGYAQWIHRRTGLAIDAYFSATKLRWILDHVEGASELARRGEILFGTIDSYLLYRLTGGKEHKTDYSNASRTMLFNIVQLDWDEDILELLSIPRSMLPQVCPSSGLFGYTDPGVFGASVPITGMAGDQQAALFGQCGFEKGQAKNTYGTGAFLLMNTGTKPVFSENGLVTTIAWGRKEEVIYGLEGSVFVAGSAIQWLRDQLGFFVRADETERMAYEVEDSRGVIVVPAFTGLGAPYWDQYARGLIIGLTRGVNKNHIVRATLESLCYLSYDVLDAMEKDLGDQVKVLHVDGGASANSFLMQTQADILQRPILRAAILETTALGAAYLAGLEIGYWRDIEDVKNTQQEGVRFIPKMDHQKRATILKNWHRAVGRSMKWAEMEE